MPDLSLAGQTLGGAQDSGAGGLVLTEQPLRGMITLRGELKKISQAVEKSIGCAVPDTRRVLNGERGDVLWMSPDELLLTVPYEEVGDRLSVLSEMLEGTHHLAVDVSDARAIFRLEGDTTREVLAKGAPVDLSRGAFGVGDVRRTRIGQVAAAFYQVDEEPDVFEIICFRSYAQYLWDWLVASSREGSMPGVLR